MVIKVLGLLDSRIQFHIYATGLVCYHYSRHYGFYKFEVLPRVEASLLLLLSKCKRVNFHSFKELNAGQHVFEWKITLKGVKVANLIKISTLYRVKKNQFHIHFKSEFYHSKMCCSPLNSFTRFFHTFLSFCI